MSSHFPKSPSGLPPIDDAQTVAALVRMLSGMGIDRSKIDAMIHKASKPGETGQEGSHARPANRNGPRSTGRRSA